MSEFTYHVVDEIGIMWWVPKDKMSGVPYVRESTVWVPSRTGIVKARCPGICLGFGVVSPSAPRYDALGWLRRVWWLSEADWYASGPCEAVDIRSIVPGSASLRWDRSSWDPSIHGRIAGLAVPFYAARAELRNAPPRKIQYDRMREDRIAVASLLNE